MMNPLDMKRKALGAVKAYGREGMGEHLKKGYAKPALAISIKTERIAPKGEMADEMAEGEGMMPEKMLGKHEGMEPEAVKMAEGEGLELADKAEKMAGEKMGEEKPEITPELLEMLLEKLGK